MLDAAANAGFAVSGEVAREILKEPRGMELRASDPQGFAQAMLEREVAAYEAKAAAGGPVIFDRGFPDIVGFHDLSGLPIPPDLDRACTSLRYDGPIFRAPPWKAIYVADPERIQDWDEAIASDAAVSAAWRRYGYELSDLPLASVEERLAFVVLALARPA